MPSPDLPFPNPPASALRAMKAAQALAEADPAGARSLATPLLGQPALHVQALVLLIDLCRRLGDVRAAVRLADRAARLAPKSGCARSLAALTLIEAGQPERALPHALAAFALTPDDVAAQVSVVRAALAVSRPLAGLDAALSLCHDRSQPECLPLAAGLFEACAGGQAWGAAWAEGTSLVGCVRPVAPGTLLVDFSIDGEVVGRVAAEYPIPGLAPLAGFRFDPPAGLLAGTCLDVTLADAGTPLFGAPARLPEPRGKDGNHV